MKALITPTVVSVLQEMARAERAEEWEDAEIVQDGGQVWLGLRRLSVQTVNRLLVLVLVRHTKEGGCDHYTLNEDGRRVAANPNTNETRDFILNRLRELSRHGSNFTC